MATKNPMPTVAPCAAKEPGQGKAPELLELAKLCDRHNIGQAVFAGVCAAQGWCPGKKLGEQEFLQAVLAFNTAPMSGRKPAENAARGNEEESNA